MQTAHLQMFLDVVQTLGFSAVAERRNTYPSTVARSISTLEESMGARLFTRNTRQMALTEAGKILAARAGNILAEIDATRDLVHGSTTALKGNLSVTTSVAFGEHVLAGQLAAFVDENPGIEPDLRLTDANVDIVQEGIDLAVRLGPTVADGLTATLLMSTRYQVVASPRWVARHGNVESPSHLSGIGCIVLDLPGIAPVWRFRDADRVGEVRPAITGKSNSPLGVRTLAIHGTGPALLADWFIADALGSGALVDLFPTKEFSLSNFDTGVWLVYADRTMLPRRVRACIDYLKAAMNTRQ